MIEIGIKKRIKNYSYCLFDDILQIWVIDLNNNEFIVATIHDCRDMNDFELDILTLETLENLNYEIIGD